MKIHSKNFYDDTLWDGNKSGNVPYTRFVMNFKWLSRTIRARKRLEK